MRAERMLAVTMNIFHGRRRPREALLVPRKVLVGTDLQQIWLDHRVRPPDRTQRAA